MCHTKRGVPDGWALDGVLKQQLLQVLVAALHVTRADEQPPPVPLEQRLEDGQQRRRLGLGEALVLHIDTHRYTPDHQLFNSPGARVQVVRGRPAVSRHIYALSCVSLFIRSGGCGKVLSLQASGDG